jgi:hypothetical protein
MEDTIEGPPVDGLFVSLTGELLWSSGIKCGNAQLSLTTLDTKRQNTAASIDGRSPEEAGRRKRRLRSRRDIAWEAARKSMNVRGGLIGRNAASVVTILQ